MLSPVLVSAPASEPITLSEAKEVCRAAGFTDDDIEIADMVSAAVEHFDGWTGILGRCLITQSWSQAYESFGMLRLPIGPVASVTSVTYFDADNTAQTLSTDIYELRTDEAGSYIRLKPDQVWPSIYCRVDAVTVTYVCGTAADAVPAPIKRAILMLVAHMYENRKAVTATSMAEMPMGVHYLIAPYRKIGV